MSLESVRRCSARDNCIDPPLNGTSGRGDAGYNRPACTRAAGYNAIRRYYATRERNAIDGWRCAACDCSMRSRAPAAPRQKRVSRASRIPRATAVAASVARTRTAKRILRSEFLPRVTMSRRCVIFEINNLRRALKAAALRACGGRANPVSTGTSQDVLPGLSEFSP